MTLDDLIQDFRDTSDDLKEPYLWSDELIISYADKAENEACSRRPLLTSSSDIDLCKIPIVADTSIYKKHMAIREVYYAKLTTNSGSYALSITNIDELTFMYPDWDRIESYPRFLILTDNQLQIVPMPIEDGVLELSISHVPKESMYDRGEPEINEAHHYGLVYWMLHLGYSKRDADTFNPKKAIDYAQLFANIFGDMKNANSVMSVRTVRDDRSRGGWV